MKESGEVFDAKHQELDSSREMPGGASHRGSASPDKKRPKQPLAASEDLYRLLVEAAGQAGHGVVILQDTEDKAGEIAFVNAAFAAALGYADYELLGLTIGDLVCPEDLPVAAERYVRRQKGEDVPPCYDFRVLRRDGTRMPIEGSAVSAVIDGKVSTMAFLRNTSQQVQMVETLERNERRYRLLAESISDVMWVTDANLKPVHVTSSIVRLLGYTVEEVVGRTLIDFLTPASFETAAAAFSRVLDESRRDPSFEPPPLEVELMRKDGTTVCVESNISFVRDPSGQVVEAVGVLHDITQRKIAEDSLRESEEKYRHLVENINAVIYSVDENGVTTYISPTFKTLFGTDPAELVGKRFADFVHPEDLSESVENLRKVMSDSLREPWECRMVLPGTSQIYWVQGHNRPIYKDGTIVGFQGVLVDITVRKQAEEAIQISERKYRTLVESSPDGILSVDTLQRIVECNEGICRLLGYAKEEIKGADVRKVTTSSTLERGDAFTQEVDEHGCAEAELEMLHRDGHSVPVWVKMVGMQGEKQSDYQILAYLRDIEERKKLDELKDQFIGLVSHELRTPLTVIMGAVSTVLSEAPRLSPRETRRLLEDAASEAELLSDILENLLELSRSRAERLTLHLEPVVLQEVVGRAVDQVRRRSSAHKFVVDLPRTLLPIHADGVRLERVLHNLLDNADKYSLEGEIRVSASRKGRNVIIEVHDQGPGIPPEDQATLFRPFQRIERGDEDSVQGIGLGLLVCRSLVEAHGGRIWVESNPGQGTSFLLTLPVDGRRPKRSKQ